nr:PREDICTED: uncharacterized protein LOC105662797 [Megachile rotundata]
MTPFEVLIGTRMRHTQDLEVQRLIQQEAIELYNEERDQLRQLAKQNIIKIQEENVRNHNKTCTKAREYKEGDLVVIKRTQFGPGLKIKKKFLGPYRVSRVKRNNRYEVIRIGDDEGPKITSTASDYMKPYLDLSSGTEDRSGTAECGIR